VNLTTHRHLLANSITGRKVVSVWSQPYAMHRHPGGHNPPGAEDSNGGKMIPTASTAQ